MTRLNLKQQLTSITAIIGIISIAIALTVIIPTIKSILDLEDNINNTQEYLEQEYEKTQKMRESMHRLEATLEKTEKFKNILPKDGDELKIITELELLASKNEIEQTLKVKKSESGKALKDVIENLAPSLKNKPFYTFSINLSGSFEQSVNYIKELEQMPYYFIINSISINKKFDSSYVETKFDAFLFITE